MATFEVSGEIWPSAECLVSGLLGALDEVEDGHPGLGLGPEPSTWWRSRVLHLAQGAPAQVGRGISLIQEGGRQ